MTVKVEDLSEAVLEELHAYSDELMTGLKKDVRAVARTCRAEIQEDSPVSSGDYRDGWKVQKTFESNDDIRLTVHNDAHYQRTHLLENGHANVDGGFTPGTPHIKPAADHAAATLEGKAKVRCSGAG